MAERVGFEPTVRCRTAVFKTASLNHSDISPCGHSRYAVSNAYLIYQIYSLLSSLSAKFFAQGKKMEICYNFSGSKGGKTLYRNIFLLYNKTNKNHPVG